MLTSIKSALLSVAIGLGTLASVPATASAEGIYFGLGIDDGGPAYDYDGNYAVPVQDGYYRKSRRMDYGRRCTPEQAAYKARRMGLRRARVVDIDRRTITVRARGDFGGRRIVVFGRAPNCPVVDRY